MCTMHSAFWSLWGATAFLLVVFWSVEFQLISDLKTLPRTRMRMRGTAVQFACRALDPTASHLYPQTMHTSPAPGIALAHPVLVEAPGFVSENIKAPALRRMPSVHSADCLFDRRGSQPDAYRTTRLSWLSHGYALSLLGPTGVDLFDEDVLLSERVCEDLYNDSTVKGSLVPYRGDVGGTPDALGCTERLALENRTWAGFYCQIHPLALLDVCPSLEAAQRNTTSCSLKNYVPPIRPGCCERIFNGDAFFRIRYNETGESYFILKNQTLNGSIFSLALLDETYDFANASDIANYTDTFTLALRYNSSNPEWVLRANLLPLYLDPSGAVVLSELQASSAGSTLVNVYSSTHQQAQSFNSSVCIVQNFSLSTTRPAPTYEPAHLTCTKGPEISEARYICTHVDGLFLRGEFRSTPCPKRNEYMFHQQPGTGLLMYGNSPLCALADTGLVVLGNANDDCFPHSGVFMYPTNISSPHTQPRAFMATVVGTANQTQPSVQVVTWAIDPLQNTVSLIPQSTENSKKASALYREGTEPVWPGVLGWEQRVPQDKFVGLDLDRVDVATSQTSTQTSTAKVWTVEYAAPGFLFFFNGDDKQLFTQNIAKKKVPPGPRYAPTFTQVVAFQNMPVIDTTFYPYFSGTSQPFVQQLNEYDSLKNACALETLHQHTTLFFSDLACAEAYAHVHWRFFTNNQSGYCTQDFTPRVQNNTFDCLAPEANGGEANHVSGYFRLDSLAENISEYFLYQDTNMSEFGFELYVPAIAHFPAHSVGSVSPQELECGYVPTDETITYANMNLTMRFNLTKILPQLCWNYARRDMRTQGGWIGTRLVAGSACESVWPPFPAVQTEFSVYNVSDMQLTGGSKYASHTWPTPAFKNYTEYQITWEDGLLLCVERYEKAKDVLEEMTYFPNMFLANSIRSSWIFSKPEKYYGDETCTEYSLGKKITCNFTLPPRMEGFANKSSVGKISNLKCNKVIFYDEGSPRCYGYFNLEITFPNNPEFSPIYEGVHALMLGLDTNRDYVNVGNMAAFRRGYQAYIFSKDAYSIYSNLFKGEDWLRYSELRQCVETQEVSFDAPNPNVCVKYKPTNLTSASYDKGDMWERYSTYGGNTAYTNRIDENNNPGTPLGIRSLLYDRFLEPPRPAECGTTADYFAKKPKAGSEPCRPLQYLNEHSEIGSGLFLNYSIKDVRIHARFEYEVLYA